MKHLHVIILAFSFFCFNGVSYAQATLAEFSTTNSKYTIYEDEYVTICLDETTGNDLENILDTDIQLDILNGWDNFNNPSKKIQIKTRDNCFHFKAKKSNALGKNGYDVKFSTQNNQISLPPDIRIVVKKVHNPGTLLNQNNLFIKGIDSSVDKDGSDKIILGNTVPITQYTSFSLSSYQNTANENDFAASYNFMYTGEHPMDDNGTFCILISDLGYQAFGDIPDVNISFNGQDFTPFFSITNALPNPTSSPFVPTGSSNIIAISQGDYFINSSNETAFVGNTISTIGINSSDGTLGNGNGGGGLGPNINFDPNGDFSAIFVCDGNLYFCDIQSLFESGALWNIQNGGEDRDDFDDDTCIDFCSIIDNDCSGIDYEIDVVDCEIVFNISNCNILTDSDIKWYYKSSDECNSTGNYTELIDANFTSIKDSPTSVEISLPIPYNSGCYMVEVYCEECLSPITKEFEIDECCPFAYTIDSKDATCNPTGNIDLEITGVGIPPFTYAWNNGSSNQDINNLNEGEYNVTVTDANGCTDIISSYVESCCCEFILDFGGVGLEISDIYVNQIWLSTHPNFTFPYDNNGETSSGANLQDLVNDLNSFEATQGSASLQNGKIFVETCNIYEYIIGNDMNAKNDDCENNHVHTIENSCDYVIDHECDLNFDVVSNGNCSIDIVINENNNYQISLEYKAFGSNIWTPVISGIAYSTSISYAATGVYRITGVGIGVCEDVVSCEIEHVCCECDIASVELLGDYLEDGELCQGIDSLGFQVITQNCLGNTNVVMTKPNGDELIMTEVMSNVHELIVENDPDEDDSGPYEFNAEDNYGCFDIEEYEVEIENCELCANCELLLEASSTIPGLLDIDNFSVGCGIIDSFEIFWYLNEVSPGNIQFKTGTAVGNINLPLNDFPVQGGIFIPVIDWLSINGVYYNNEYPGIGQCLDSIFVTNPNCDNPIFVEYDYNLSSYPDRVINFVPNESSNYIRINFIGEIIHDTILITNNEDIVYYAVVGQDLDLDSDITTSPNILDRYSVVYLIDINDLNLSQDSILSINVNANKTEPSTNWSLGVSCYDNYNCGEVGELDIENITCSYDDSLNCRYYITIPHIGDIKPQFLPTQVYYSLNDLEVLHKNICSSSNVPYFSSADYCDQDSMRISANVENQTYTLDFLSDGGFYQEVKNACLAKIDQLNVDCEYNDTVSYYKYLRITALSGLECFPPSGSGDNVINNTYSTKFWIHPCPSNFIFDDVNNKITFKKTTIINYHNGNCDECESSINGYVSLINDDVNPLLNNIDLVMHQVTLYGKSFKYIDVNNLDGELIRQINYEYYAAELCDNDECNKQKYKIIIDDINDGCNNFSIYEDTSPCDGNNNYDSLIYQITNGTESYSANQDIQTFMAENDLTTLVEDYAYYKPEVSVYPNPARKKINVLYTSNKTADTEIIIYDRTMREVNTFNVKADRGQNEETIDISEYNSGLFYIRIKQDNESMFQKFIVIN